MDKASEFRRINEPRAMRMLEQLNHIEKSAKSMRIDEAEARGMLTPVRTSLGATAPVQAATPPVGAMPQPGPVAAAEPAPQVAYKRERIEALPTTDLIDLIAACGIEIASRRTS